MSGSSALPPTPEEALKLHQRLREGDPTAANDLVVAYLEALVGWLSETNPRVHPDLCLEAAEDALLALIRKPLA